MSISPEIIDKIRLSTDIVELVREYVPGLKKAGRNWRATCPFHHEKTPSFMVSPEKGIFHCFGCHSGGDVFKFLMLIDSLTWPEAVKRLGYKAGITVKETKDDIIKRSEKQKLYDLLESAAEFYHRCFNDLKEASIAREYIKKRGISEESVKKFRIGYAPQGMLIAAAAKKGYSVEQLISAGLIMKNDSGKFFEYMSRRLVFPIYDAQGRVVAFGGRTLANDQAKYLNSPETVIYSKSSQLYGLYQAIQSLRQDKEAIILEGYTDVVATQQAGVTNTVAALGTALTKQHSHILQRYIEKVILLFDADDAGNKAARRAIDVFLDTDLTIRVVNLPSGLDPDEYILKHGKESFKSYIQKNEKSPIEFLIEQSMISSGGNSPEAKMKMVMEIIPFISKVRNSVLQQEWISILAYKLQIREDDVRSEVKKSLKSNFKNKIGEVKPASLIKCSRTIEEEVLQIISAYPQYAYLINEDMFADERNKLVCSCLVKGVAVSDMLKYLKESDMPWFTELVLEESKCSSPEQSLSSLARDLKQSRLKTERQKLEGEIILMIDGKIPTDETKMQLYHDLNRQLKGSVK